MVTPQPPQRVTSGWRDPLILFIVVRAALLLVSLYTFGTLATAPPHKNPNLAFYYYGLPAITDPVFGPTIGVWQRWDTNHYLQIVLEGYATNPRSSAFMPLLPLLAWRLTPLFGGGVLGALIALLLISHAATFGLLVVLQQLARDEGFSPAATRFTLAALLLFPTSFFLFAGYTESLFIFLAVLSFWATRRGYWPLAALPAVAFGAVLLWRAAMGFPALDVLLLSYWGRVPGYPGQGIVLTVIRIATNTLLRPAEWLDLLVTLLMIVLLVVMLIQRRPLSYAAYTSAMLLLTLINYSEIQPLMSQARYALALFPAFLLLGDGLSRLPRWLAWLLLVASGGLMLVLTHYFMTWELFVG